MDEPGADEKGVAITTTEEPADRPAPPQSGWALILAELRSHGRGLAVGVGVGLAWTAAKVAVPSLVRAAIDRGIVARDGGALARWVAAIGVAAVVAAIFTGLRRYWAFRVSRLVEARLRDRLFAHIQRLHAAYHDGMPAGELMSRSNTDLHQIQSFVVLIPLTVANALTVAAVAVILLVVDWRLALLALGPLPLLNGLGKRFSTKLHPEVLAIARESAELASVVEESVSGVRVVKGFGSQALQVRRLRREADDLYRASTAAAQVRARYLPAMEVLPNLGLILVLGFGGHQVLAGNLTVGQLVAFDVYIFLLIWPLRMLGMIIAQGQRAVASADRVAEVLAAEPEIEDAPAPRPLPARAGGRRGAGGAPAGLGAVRYERVSFSYGAASAPVLTDLDLVIEPGESLAIVGATGAGKSTVARLLARFYDPSRGRVSLDGVDVREVSLRELRRAVGMVFEDTFLFDATIAQNIAFAEPGARRARIEWAARLAGAHEFIDALPAGYATEIGERGFSLSGGQRQRIAIARAILADPRVLILDDATSAVDPAKEHEIRDALAEVMRDRTTIVIAHRPATVALADRVVLLRGGAVAAEGTHAELLATCAAYREVLAAAGRDLAADEVPAP